MIVDALESDPATPILSAVVEAARAVQVGNFEPPSWASLSHGARPPPREPDEFEPGCSRRGWQHEAASRTEMVHRDTWIMPRLTDDERAMLRSQSGPGSGLAFSSVPASAALRIDSHHFRVLFLRRLRLPLPPVSRTCWCGRLLDPFGHHRAACSRAGVLAGGVMLWRAWELGSAARQGRGSRRMSSFVTWICWHPMLRTRGGWKSWPRVCHCMVEHSWRWTPHWCRRTIVTGLPDLGRRTSMEQHLWWLGAARKGPVPSWLALEAEPSWWCWLARLADGGLQRRRLS